MEIIKNLGNLLKVKTLITFAVMAVFVVLALTGKISADNAMIIISMVVSFYFGTQTREKNKASAAPVTAPNTETVAVIAEQATPVTASVDNATYSHIHPDSE